MTLRMGIIGAAGHIDFVFDDIDSIEDIEIEAVAPGVGGEDMHRLDEFLGPRRPNRFDHWEAMLESTELDLVCVAPPYYLHEPIATACLKRDLPIFCEKPLALHFEGLERLRAAHDRSGVPLGIMLDFRYAPAFYTARKLVRAGAIGEPTVSYSQKSYKRGRRPEFFKDRQTWGGIIPWVGIHAIDWLTYVSGRHYLSVSAHHVKLGTPEYPGVEDGASCHFEMDNGGSAVMSFDYLRPAGAPSHADDYLRLMGQEGALEVRGRAGSVTLCDASGVREVPLESPPRGLFADFVEQVRNPGHDTLVSVDEAFRATELALRTRQAADLGQRVEFDASAPI